ncbi:flavodoxin family protein [Fervidobacterium thailandense]|uniref:Flavodoxin n=1 Tax=Fervidobacterium thailandense TaxID=1008305 RepID=A0A1E3G5L3_9BACT|nr:flavodoxin family protein [Fervidobacterium thailandense]ODN31440.1 flavodoxin [Fervidobacterium thailandense]
MKILLTYSSLTGNTKKVADGIFEILDKSVTTYLPMSEIENPEEFVKDFDLILIGCWVDKGMPNKEAAEFIQKVKNKKVGLFMTLGASPQSKHAHETLQKSVELIEKNNNTVVAKFICQGKISEKLIEFFKTLPPEHPHALTEEKLKQYEIAAKHPDQEDIKNAQELFLKVVDELCNSANG